MFKRNKLIRFCVYGFVVNGLNPVLAHAQMPLESGLQTILSSLQGPTARYVITISIVLLGLAFCTGESGGFFRKCTAALFGGAVAVGAASFAATVFGL